MTNAAVNYLPRTKLWNVDDGPIIVLECVCERAVDYPGHPDDRTVVTCENCGQTWAIKDTS